MSIATASQAWAILARHARDDIQSLRLFELCQDNHRVSSLVAVHASDEGTLIVDFSRQRMTLETLHHLLHLANARGCIHFMQEELPYHHPPNNLYLALRAPRGSVMVLQSDTKSNSNNNSKITNACFEIHTEWERIHRLSDSIRRGQLRGVSGAVLKDVVVVGRGVSMHALKFIYEALLQDPAGYNAAKEGLAELLTRRTFTTSAIDIGHRRLRLVSSIDAAATRKAIADLEAASTIVISLALTGHEETGLASRLLKHWLMKELAHSSRKTDLIFSKHMLLITGNDRIYQASKPESVFLVPSFCRSEPFCTLSTMTLLPLSIIFGWSQVHDGILTGAHAMDTHMVETNPRHNLPLLLALVDLWNDAFLTQHGRLVQSFGEALSDYGSFVAALESQVCGSPSQPAFGNSSCGMVFSGNMYDQSLHHSSRALPTELYSTMDPVVLRGDKLSLEDIVHHQDALLCSMFGHADELSSGANRPSTVILCGRLNAYMCGQLVALTEHRALIKGKLWDIMPLFPVAADADTAPTPMSDKLSRDLTNLLDRMSMGDADMDEDEELVLSEGGSTNLSTSTLLTNYAGRTREFRKSWHA